MAHDRRPDHALYARHGMPQLSIIDIGGRVVELCSQSGPEGYDLPD